MRKPEVEVEVSSKSQDREHGHLLAYVALMTLGLNGDHIWPFRIPYRCDADLVSLQQDLVSTRGDPSRQKFSGIFSGSCMGPGEPSLAIRSWRVSRGPTSLIPRAELCPLPHRSVSLSVSTRRRCGLFTLQLFGVRDFELQHWPGGLLLHLGGAGKQASVACIHENPIS